MPPFSPNWFLRNRWWVIPGMALGLLVLFGSIIVGLVLLTGLSLKQSEMYRAALEKARAHPQVIEALGEPIQPGWYITGTLMEYEGETQGDLVVLLKGPRAGGLLHAEFYGDNFEDLTLDVRKAGQRIFLLMDLPPHDLKLVKQLDRVMEYFYKEKADKARTLLDTLAAKFPDQPLVHLNRASLYLADRDFAAAQEEAGRVIARHDRCREAFHLRADASLQAGDLKTALGDYSRLIELEPDDPWNFNNKAWLLCTTEDQTLRDGPAAVQLAERAADLSERQYPAILDTLACAYAECSNFEKAVNTQQEALAHEQPAAQKSELRARLEKFKQGLPHRIATY